MKIKALKTLISLAENDCDFGIYRALGIPRTSMWNHVSELEKETGLTLVVRKKQHTSFTDEGLAFIPYARKIYEAFEQGVTQAKKNDLETISGQIVISTTQAVASTWLIQSIKKFNSLHPHLRVTILASDKLSSKTIQASDIILRPIGVTEDFKKIWNVAYQHALFASKEYLKNRGTPKTPDDLKDHCIIAYGESEFTGFDEINWHLKGKQYGLPKLYPTLTINNTVSIYSAASEGIGICSTPIESNIIYDGKLTRVLPDIQGPTLKTYFCEKINTSKAKQKNILIFREFLKSYLQGIRVNVNAEKEH